MRKRDASPRSSHDDEAVAFAEVLADLNRDVAAVLERARGRGAPSA